MGSRDLAACHPAAEAGCDRINYASVSRSKPIFFLAAACCGSRGTVDGSIRSRDHPDLRDRQGCIITACRRQRHEALLPLIDQIEAYAKREGCASGRIYGRKGWLSVLDAYDDKNHRGRK